MINKIISGAQTGADRAGLDVAIRHGFSHGGWCPKGRKAEDGPIGGQYQLIETPSASYLQRTEWNARDSDGTVVFTLAREVTGGSLRTIEFAKRHKRPWIHISRAGEYITRGPDGQTITTSTFGSGYISRDNQGGTTTTSKFGGGTITRGNGGGSETTAPFGSGYITRGGAATNSPASGSVIILPAGK